MQRILGSAWIAVLLLCLAGAAMAQTEMGSISGRVIDSSGSAVPGAEIRLVNEATSASQRALTEPGGDFVFTTVLPGFYILNIAAKGFKIHQVRNVTLTAN